MEFLFSSIEEDHATLGEIMRDDIKMMNRAMALVQAGKLEVSPINLEAMFATLFVAERGIDPGPEVRKSLIRCLHYGGEASIPSFRAMIAHLRI